MRGIFLGLGSNLGERKKYLESAIKELEKRGARVVKKSTVLETEPLGGLKQPKYLNMVCEVETELDPEELLRVCSEVENLLGRERGEKWAARTIDIDILLYGRERVDLPHLKIPHPGVADRWFVKEEIEELRSADTYSQ